MAQPRTPVVPTGSVVAIIDAFLDWCSKHRSPDTYELCRSRLERFARTDPDLLVGDLRPFHVQEWIDAMDVESGTKRNYCRFVKRCVRWAKKQGYNESDPIADMEQPKGGKRETVLSDEQYNELLSLTLDPTFRELLTVTWEIGCRPQESLHVGARHVDLTNQRWVFQEAEARTDIPRVVYPVATGLRQSRVDEGTNEVWRRSRVTDLAGRRLGILTSNSISISIRKGSTPRKGTS